MRLLIACERSGVVRDAFLARGHSAISCDTAPSERPGPHIQADVVSVLDWGWDIIIAHPPCTYLCNSAAWAFSDGPYHQRVRPETLVGAARRAAREDALRFVDAIWSAPCASVCLENPAGCLNTRRPDMPRPQWVQPYQFGDDASKRTGLWLRGLPPLRPLPDSEQAPPRMVDGRPRWANQTDTGQNRLSPGADRARLRSQTYPGIARAMAEQWGDLILQAEDGDEKRHQQSNSGGQSGR